MSAREMKDGIWILDDAQNGESRPVVESYILAMWHLILACPVGGKRYQFEATR